MIVFVEKLCVIFFKFVRHSILQSLKYETRTKSYETKMVGSLNLETAQIIPETLELKPETQMTTKVNNGNLFSKKE